ncbi:MAG: hypothetical protein V3R99_03175 [Thermoguttaceae bacterium]
MLNAKDELEGQTRKCPKCGTPLVIAKPDPSEMPSSESPQISTATDGGGETTLRPIDAPVRLDPTSRYLILDETRLVAAWKNDSQGWMLKTTAGLIGAKQNRDQLPTHGNFKFVELKVVRDEEGPRLSALTSHQLATGWALTALDKGDNQILSKITAPGSLNRDQKAVIRLLIRDQLMYEVWQNSRGVLDYLADNDYHSPGTA